MKILDLLNNLHFLTKYVAEKVVTSQLVNHCNENAPLPVNQSAYRQLHSTETALLKVQNDILINMDNEEVTLLVMLDMSAAFDTIDHNILIDILKNDFGVVDSVVVLFIQSSKTEFIIIGSRQQLSKVSIDKLRVGEVLIFPVSAVRDLGSWLDIHMSMNMHVSKICSKAFRSLYHIKQIRKYLTDGATKILVHAFITSHLDYCNSLLYGIPKYQLNRLQKVLNAAARVVCLVPKFDHITPTLMRLHDRTVGL